ncbi:MAG: ABC transporter permease [Gammaproteobacteria bacterium HGW-Gammaproteobacteria-10]|nr:MAG: ABC transporter permease [Gammaproteobacteria bacterium HGW-Gammaproteobacteria-10]
MSDAGTNRLGLLLLASVCLFPLAYLLLRSFAFDWRYPALLPSRWSLNAWEDALLGGGKLGLAALRSLACAVLVACLATCAGFISSRMIARHRRRALLLYLAHIPFVLSPVIFGICLLPLYLQLNLVGGFTGVALAQFTLAYAYAILYFQSFWGPRTQALEEQISTLGGNQWQIWTRVLIPKARPFGIICLLQTGLLSWFDYGFAAVIGAGKFQTLTVLVFAYLGEANQTLAAAAATLLTAPLALLVLLMNKHRLKP